MTLQTGQILDGKYRIIRELGSGSMGAVYEGENLQIHRRVAIKVLLPSVAQRKDTVQRFEREAQAAGRIGSEHIVDVLDLGIMADGGFYMVMEFLEGMTLRDRIRSRGRLTPRDIVPVAQQLLTGLELAHDAGIIHRDLKPDNVFLMREHAGQPDFVKILDFGVSKFNPLNCEDGMSMTRTGTVVGTPFYMAPEQAKGARDVDERSDLYSVGIILYEAITGQVPFHAGTFNELIFKIVLETPPPPETFVPDLDPAFGRIVRRAMAREANGRFQSAAEFREVLSVWLHTGQDSAAGPLTPPPPASVDLDWDDEAETHITDLGAHPGDCDGAQTLVVEPLSPLVAGGPDLLGPDDGAATLIAEPLSPAAKLPSHRPPPRRAPPRRQQPPPAPTPEPHQPQQSDAPAPRALVPSSLSPNAPTPVPGAEEPVWPIAGVPMSGMLGRRKPFTTAIIVSVVATVSAGALAGVLLLTGSKSESAGVDEVEETSGADSQAANRALREARNDGAEDTPKNGDDEGDEGDEGDDEDDGQVATDDDDAADAPTTAETTAAPPPPKKAAKPPPPKSPPKSTASPPPASTKTGTTKGKPKKPKGRKIKTEL